MGGAIDTGTASAAATVLPGSPYRTSSTGAGLHHYGGLFNGSSISSGPAKHSLSKELMQKLRSMTETIKMLSDENEVLKRENDRIKDEEEGVYVVKQSKVLGHQNVGNVGILPEASKAPSGQCDSLNESSIYYLSTPDKL